MRNILFILITILLCSCNEVCEYKNQTPTNTKDAELVSWVVNYEVSLGNDPYEDKHMCVDFLIRNTILLDSREYCYEDYINKSDEIKEIISQKITKKVSAKFPKAKFKINNIVFQ